MLGESLEHPVAVIFEDLHWIDSETQALLDLLAASIANSRFLLLVNYRPEYRHEWANKSYYSQLRLDALGGESAAAMLAALLGDAVELAPLKRLIVERTGGNPFFIEEMVQALFDEGTLMRSGAVKVTSSLSQLRLPPTVQGILASRIDRLSAEQKELLQTLAVIGRESPLGLIRKVAAITEEQLKRMLSDLRAAEFIYEQPALTEAEYVFKHALTQEVAYNSLLRERRKQIHERAAQAIEALFALNISDQYSELAHHYGRSGNGSTAVKYLRLAAEQAMSRSAYMEARDRLNSALELLHAQPDEPERDRTEISLRFSLNICMKFSGGLGTAASVENMERARQLCEMVGDDTSLFEALDALEDQYFQSAEHQKIQAVGEELLKIATRTNNSEMLGRALFWLGAFSGMRGEFTAAAEALEQARSLSARGWLMLDAQGWYDWRIETRTYAAPVWWTLGFPERAMARSAESFEVARAIAASPSVLMIALSFSSFLNLRCRDWKMALSHIDEAKRLADEYGMIDPTGFFRGWAVARLGQPEDGLAKMLPARGWMTALRRWRPLFFWGLADVYLALGDARQGLEVVNHALEGSRCEFEAELRRVKGELLLIADEGAVAEPTQCFRDSIELARRQSAKSWELRATTSLARLLAKQERGDEARAMLAEIYNWFTEGFDTADLKDARALLDELSG